MGGNSPGETVLLFVALIVVIYITWMLILYSRLSTQSFKIGQRMEKMFEAVKDQSHFLTILADAVDAYDPEALKDSPVREQMEAALAAAGSAQDYYGIVEASRQLDDACESMERVMENDPTLQGNNSRIRNAYARFWSFKGDFDMAKGGFNGLIRSYNRRVSWKFYYPVTKLFKFKEVPGFHVPEIKRKLK